MTAIRELDAAELDLVAGGGLWGSIIDNTVKGIFTAGGAGAGAIIGSEIGSIIPGPGTIIGGIVGGLIGGAAGIIVGSGMHD